MAATTTDSAHTPAQSKSPPRAVVVMVVLLFIFFLGTSDNSMISPLLPLIAAEVGLEVGRVGSMILPAYAIAAAAASLVIGPVSDRLGRRKFLLYASVIFGLSLLAAMLIKDARVLIATRVLTGLAAGTFSTCSIAYVADYFPYEKRGVAMSVVQAGYFLALVVGVPVATHLAAWRNSYRPSFAFFASLSALAFVIVLALLPDDGREVAARNASATPTRRFNNIRMSFEGRERIAAIAAAFCVTGGFVGFFSYLGAWLKDTIHLSTTQIGYFFPVVGVALVIGAFVAGPVSDTFGKRGLSIMSTLALAAMLFVIPRFGWGLALIASFLTASLAFAFRQGPLQALATELVPSNARGAFVAVRNTASQIGFAVSTGVSGYLYDHGGYEAVGLFGAALTLGAAVCIFLIREPAQRTIRVDVDPGRDR
ncbi:MAG TPA: MFS transporter [Blastocatellia bacterium]|nr:MFS transporter [Blastocatellia bacterium]